MTLNEQIITIKNENLRMAGFRFYFDIKLCVHTFNSINNCV